MKFFVKNALFLIVFFFATIKHLIGQNLVVNPSFEITNTNCTGFAGEGFRQDLNPSWDNANSNIPGDSCSSPDLFSACNIAFTNMPGGGLGSLGYQYSRTGTRHAGLIAYSAPFGFADNYREYIQGHTSAPLVGGQTYCVSMYVSLADGSPWAIKELGVYFSNTQYLRDACNQGSGIYVTPQLENNCGIITDTTYKWVRLQWDYVASGGEQYFVIGNFNNDAGTTKASTGSSSFSNTFAYYFIDDVSIVANSCCFADIAKVNSQCLTGSAITLTASPGIGAVCTQSVNGTWSGPGITNATTGVFNPSVAGIGVHTISLTLSCGYTATTSVAVSPCAALSVCKETNGSITASNGVAPYTWSTFVPAASTPITNQAQCQACGYNWIGFPLNQCLNGVAPATSCTTAATWSVFATGNNITIPGGITQVKIVDGSGTTITFTPSMVPNCSVTPSCPTLTMAITSQTNVNCFGTNTGSATVNTTGGTGPYTYTWNPANITGASQTNLSAGTYTINILDANLCAGSGTVTITQPTASLTAVVTATSPSGCGTSTGGATVTASGGTSSYTYSWIPSGGNTAGVSNLGVGNNSVIVTDSKGCSTTGVTNILTTGGPTLAVVSQTNVNCFGSNTGAAIVNANGGTGTYSYTWTPGNLTGASQTGLNAGTYTISVVDANLCAGSGTIQITQPTSAISAIISSTIATSCGTSTGEATVTPSGGTPGYTYSWTPNGGITSGVTNLGSGSNSVTVTDTKGCSVTVVANITTAGGPTLSVVSQASVNCFGASTGSATVNGNGGTAPYTYTWNPGNLSGASQTGLSAGIYTINITDAGLCAGSGTILISQPTLSLSAAITATTATGCGTSTGGATVTASGGTAGYTYAWIPGGGTTAGISNLGTGNNTVVVTDANSCSVTAVANITVVSIADVTIIPSSAIISCFTGSVSLTANSSIGGPYTYVWSPSVPSFTGSTFVVSNSGTYTVVAINTANSCTAAATQNITKESINASFVANPTQGFVPLPVTFTNTSVNPIGTTYNWDFGNTTTSTSTASTVSTIYDTQGVFPVTLISTNGSCQDTAIIYIKVELLSSIIVPNVFTPNNDGSNDIFTLQAINIGEINITIFDRWGLKMFEVIDSGNIKWDGKAPNGKAVPDGMYFYVIKAEGLDGKKYDLNGSINIFK